jgi:hypothetical protein
MTKFLLKVVKSQNDKNYCCFCCCRLAEIERVLKRGRHFIADPVSTRLNGAAPTHPTWWLFSPFGLHSSACTLTCPGSFSCGNLAEFVDQVSEFLFFFVRDDKLECLCCQLSLGFSNICGRGEWPIL